MRTELKLPELAESMTSATITAWLKQPGERVDAGDPIVEVDTDKTTVELEAPVTGVLRDVLVPEGTPDVEVGTVLALIDDEVTTTESSPPIANEQTAPVIAEPPRSPSAPETPPAASSAHDVAADLVSVDATPLATRMATVAGLDLSSVAGTGRNGRVMKVDIDRLLGATGQADAAYTDHALSTVRRVTAERLTKAKQTVPHFYLSVDCDVGAVAEHRRCHNERSTHHVTFTDIIVRAAALALGRVPAANSAWQNGSVRLFAHADIAVAVTTPAGLLTPIVKRAGEKTLSAIALELRDLTARARAGQLAPDEYSGGSFTISNLGMYDVTSLYAIVNPPQSCILGVGAVRRDPVVRDDAVVVGDTATVTLSADHRALDGATGGELLHELKRLLETPAKLFD